MCVCVCVCVCVFEMRAASVPLSWRASLQHLYKILPENFTYSFCTFT